MSIIAPTFAKFRQAPDIAETQRRWVITMNPTFKSTGALALACLSQLALHSVAAEPTLQEKSVSPVTNPLFFEDPYIRTEIRPIFAYHRIGDDLLNGVGLNGISEGDVRVYALQIRYAVTDRLAIIATKDGYTDIKFDNPALAGLSRSGWNDIAAGVKYAFIQDKREQFVLSGGVKIELPTGDNKVFQNNGDGEWDVFLSSAKNWDRFQLMGSAGVRIPNNFAAETASAHYSLQASYYTCRYFIPFVSLNGQTVLSETSNGGPYGLPGLNVEGFDLVNFGADSAGGHTQIVGGVGFRSRVAAHVDFGAAYESSLSSPQGLFQDRVTVDFVIHF
jgi:hypothetical protein